MRTERIEALVKEYLGTLKAEGKSEHTLKNYKLHFDKFLRFCRANGIEDLANWNGKETRAFRTWLLDKGLKATTVNTILAALSGFFVWCVDEGYMKGNPITSRAYVKAPQTTPRFMSDLELKEVRKALQDVPDHVSFVFELQLATGLRISEAISLRTEDVIVQDGSVFVRVMGKGSKERIVPVMDSTVAKKLLELKQSKQGPIFEISKSTALWWAWRIKKATGIDFTSHRLRHTVATRLLNSGIAIDVVQDLLGHASISTTRRYAKTSSEAIKKLAVKVRP